MRSSRRIRFHNLLLAGVCSLLSLATALSGLSQESTSIQDDDFCVAAALSQRPSLKEEEYFKANYEKHEYRIPMRDGVKLFTAVYTPRDNAQRHPILLTRTPYSVAPYGPDAYAPMGDLSFRFVEAEYIFVEQDVRGRYHSDGKFVHMTPEKDHHDLSGIDESTDTYDTIDWLVNNTPHNNGRVGLWGISYPGFFASAGMIAAHPALRAVSPQAPQGDWFMGDDTHHNAAFFLTSTFNFMAWFGSTTCGAPFRFHPANGYQFFLQMGPLGNADAKNFHGTSR